MNPNARAVRPAPAVQATRPPSASRSASAGGEPSSRSCGRRSSVWARIPAPVSRPRASATAAATSPAVHPARSRRTAGRAPVSGRSSTIHPMGVSHRSQCADGDASAATRSRKATAKTAPPSAAASRRVGASCEVRAPTAAKAGAAPQRASARKSPPPSGTSPSTTPTRTPAAVTANRRALAAATAASEASVARARLTGPDSSVSQRPLSSSPRSRRVAASRPQTPAKSGSRPSVRHARKPVTVSISRAGPKSARTPAFAVTVRSSPARSAGVP